MIHTRPKPSPCEHPPVSEASLKRRLTERFSVPGALVVCHRRTIIGTWKACETPFHVYNLGMGGVNFWNLGMALKPGTKIKLTLLMPKAHPIDVVGVVVWSKDMPRSDAGDGAQQYSQITGVKFVDYDAGAWAVLRQIHQIVAGRRFTRLRRSPDRKNNLKNPRRPGRAKSERLLHPARDCGEPAKPARSLTTRRLS